MENINYLRKLVNYANCLSYKVRMDILNVLIDNPGLSVNHLSDIFSVSQPVMSHYLSDLKLNGFAYSKRSGKKRLYFASKNKIDVVIAFAKIAYNVIEHNADPPKNK